MRKIDTNKVLSQPATQVAPAILGWEIQVEAPDGERLSGRIVETEAYHQDDPASHSYKGLTARTAPMFQKAGTIYVYFTYGMHYCMNIVCGPQDRGEAVLIRAIEPLQGLNTMRRNRGLAKAENTGALTEKDKRLLTSGPARLAQALGVTVVQTGTHINDGPIKLVPRLRDFDSITQTTRVGIKRAAHQPWRFYITGNPYVSKPS